jgi:F-type H+-transporting ATPase subunit a
MQAEKVDFITPHISDAHAIDYPCAKPGWVCEYQLPHWAPIHIGRYAVDISPTKHVVMIWIAGALCLVFMLLALAGHNRRSATGRPPKGIGNGLEAMILYFRQEVILPTVGPHGEKFVPYLLTVFFFVLFLNLLGLVPYGSTATGNISVTAMLAIVSFVVIEIAGMRAMGFGYWKTIIYWPDEMSLGLKLFISPILTPIELLAKFTKPFALAIRLFANMTAGHVVLLALISLIFTFGSWFIAGLPVAMGFGIMLLELFVGFLQAFIFTLLTSVFIGLMREGSH